MPAFEAVEEDEGRMKNYVLAPIPAVLARELETFIGYRTSTFQAKRAGGAVVSLSAEADKHNLLRFFGWLNKTDRVPANAFLHVQLLLRPEMADWGQDYATWLRDNQNLRFSSVANYLNGLISVTSYVYMTYEVPEQTAALDPSPLTQLINLRAQAEKASKQENLYNKRVGGWISWEQVQRARVKVMTTLAQCESSQRRALLREAAAISLLSLIPPDRVGVIRKLRLGSTLKRTAGGGWAIDLTKARDSHKTSRFYGPFAAELPVALQPVLTAYAALLEYEVGGNEAYLFHPVNGACDRVMESSAWTQFIRKLTLKWAGTAVAPKTCSSHMHFFSNLFFTLSHIDSILTFADLIRIAIHPGLCTCSLNPTRGFSPGSARSSSHGYARVLTRRTCSSRLHTRRSTSLPRRRPRHTTATRTQSW